MSNSIRSKIRMRFGGYASVVFERETSFFWVFCLILSAFLCLAALPRAAGARPDSEQITSQALAKAGPAFNFAREEKIRGFYLSGIFSKARRVEGMEYEEILAKMKEVGVNVMMPAHVVPLDFGDPGVYLDRMAEAYTAAGQHNLILLPWIDFLGNLEARLLEGNTEIARFVDEQGREYKKTPSPLDEKYWELAVGSRMAEVARMSLEHHIQGLLFDNEMYGADFSFYERVGTYCYSDKAFGGFASSRGLGVGSREVRPGRRKEWLESRGLMEDYKGYYRERIIEITSGIRERVHRINPDFILGFYTYRSGHPFYEALVLGLGSERMPCTLWPGATYERGYTARLVDDVIVELKDLGADFLYVPGLWAAQFHPSNLRAHMYKCGEKSAGYWVYGVYSFFNEWARARRRSQVLNIEEYWEAFRTGNKALSKKAQDSSYESSFAVDETLAIYTLPDLDYHKLPFAVEPLDSGFIYHEVPHSMSAARVRYNATYLLHAVKGEKIKFKLSCQQLANYQQGLAFKLLSPSGREILAGRIPYDQAEEFEITAGESGVYVLACDMGRNTANLETLNRMSLMIRFRPITRLNRRVYLKSPRLSLYFWVPAGEKEINIGLWGRVRASLVAPCGAIADETDKTSNWIEERLSVTRGNNLKGEVWRLDLGRPSEGYFGDVAVDFLPNNFPNIFSFNPESLLLPGL